MLFCTILALYGCGAPGPAALDVVPPTTRAEPAGGIYRNWPSEITLVTEAGATLHYRWEGGRSQRYQAPIQVPAAGLPHRILQFWSQDAAGNREAVHREHYVQAPEAPHVDVLSLDRTVLGGQESATLSWRSTATDATYEIAVSSSGWGPGKTLAQGAVTPDVAQHMTLAASDLFARPNRLWLRVKNAEGVMAATSRLLTVHTRPARTRAWPPSGVFGTPQTVALVTERPAAIYYTTDGSAPTPDSARYTEPLRIGATTTLRFFSVDPYGNREAPQQAHIAIQPQTATITLPTVVRHDVGSDVPLTFSWRSDTNGRYDITLQHRQHQITVQQGSVQRNEDIRSAIARNFLSPGDWRVQLRVQPETGQPGQVSFMVRVHYQDGFADTRYRNEEATTTAWDTTKHQVQLTRGPRSLGMYRTRGRGRYVTIRGAHAYLANSRGGLHIVDVSEPAQPQRAGVFYPHGAAAALAVHGHYVYMAASGSGLTIFDVADPAQPRLMATVPIRGTAADITIVAPYAYVGTRQGALVILDLSTPLQPRRVGQVDVAGRVLDIAVHQGTAYLACLDQGVVIVDVSSPQQPHVLHRWPTSNAATGVAIHGHHAFIAADQLEVLDITRPASPQHAVTHYVRSAYGVAWHAPHALVASGTDGVHLVSMTAKGSVTTKGSVASSPSGHYAARLTMMGSYALVADTRGGLQILDLSQPAQPRIAATVADIGTIVDVAVAGTTAYLANDRRGSGLVVVDLHDPEAPRVMGRYHSEMTTDVAVWQDRAILSDAAGLVQLVDIRQATRPQLLDTLVVPGKLQRLALRPPYVFVASNTAGVHVVEITDSDQLQHRTSVPMPGRALDIALADQTAYIAAVDGGIQVLDVRTPAQPVLGTPYHHSDEEGDHIIRLLAHEHTLYAIDNERGIQILRRSDAGVLRLEASVTVPRGAPWGLTAAGPYLFVTTLLHSLYSFDLTTPSQPRLLSTSPYGGSALRAAGPALYIAVRGRRGVPGGLRLVEGFAAVPERALRPVQAQGVVALPGPTPDTRLVHRAYTFHSPGLAESVGVSSPDILVRTARLRVHDFWGATGRIRYALSPDGGKQWHPAQPGVWVRFPASGTELRWRATLETTDVVSTPMIERVRIDVADAEMPRR